ncbi:MAG: hypothetical protein ACHQRM_04240 [Bacteroidia bacterium]
MKLSAFGVEADDFPSIDVYMDFEKDSSHCRKWYFNPAYKESTYSLTKPEMATLRHFLENADLNNLIHVRTLRASDQPTSTLTVYKRKEVIVIKDYGLDGDYPLKEIYKLVYKY